jgi:hypothetical protein
MGFDALIPKGVQDVAHEPCGLHLLEFGLGGLGIVGTDETIATAPVVHDAWYLGADNGVDTAQLLADFPCDFEEKWLG